MELQLKRGSTASVAGYTGPAGEIVAKSDSWELALQDGVTPGGVSVISSLRVDTPSVVSPIMDATGVAQQPVFQSTTFIGDGTHIASRLQVASDSQFLNMVLDTGRDSTHLTAFYSTALGLELNLSGQYFVRIAHESDIAGWSKFSGTIGFSIQN